MSTLWAVGCQLRKPTRLEWPSSFTTGSVRGEVSPPSGISQICPAAKIATRSAEASGRTGRDLAYHHAAVLRAAGDDVVIVRTKLDVEDGAGVAAHGGVGHVDTPCLHTQIPPECTIIARTDDVYNDFNSCFCSLLFGLLQILNAHFISDWKPNWVDI